MEMELTLRKANNDGTAFFLIPAFFLKKEFEKSFNGQKCLIVGRKYKLTIEAIQWAIYGYI